MNPDLLQGFYLDDLLIEPSSGQVTGPNGSAHLPPKSAEVLLCLAKSHGELVTRDTLLLEVWGANHGSPEALNHAVSDIRHVLNDSAERPHFIQTLPRRGYRLLVTPNKIPKTRPSTPRDTGESPASSELGFIENLKQRGVLETGLAYLVTGWLLIQVADIVFGQLGAEDRAGLVTVLIIAGFPIALGISWFIEFQNGRAVLHKLAPEDADKHRFSGAYTSVVAALAIAAVVMFAYDRTVGFPESNRRDSTLFRPEVQLPPIVENSFAVLPFFNIDGSEETQIFANGLVEDVINSLSRVPGLRVASRGDSFSLQPNTSSGKIRERLRVKMYLQGSVEMAADRLRTAIQLVDTETGFQLLSRSFDQPREDFFDVRDEIASLAVANIRVALPVDTRPLVPQDLDHPPLDAYVLYRRGMDILWQPASIESLLTALEWFDEALEVDSKYAAAHAGKCTAYVTAYTVSSQPSYISQAESSCAVALDLNSNLVVVHTALGDLYRSTGRHAGAERAYEVALDIEPESVGALIGLGDNYLRQSNLAEAETTFRRAVELHPGNFSTYNELGSYFFNTGQFEKAAVEYQRIIALEPDNLYGYANLGTAYMLDGNFHAALPAFQRALEIQPSRLAASNLGLMHYYLGDLDAAISSHESAVELAPNNHLVYSNLGDALWNAGRLDEAKIAFGQAEGLATSALQINSNDAFTIMDLAWIKAVLDKPEEAQTLIARAKQLAPDDPYTHFIEGLVYFRVGDDERAISSFGEAVNRGYSMEMLVAEPHLNRLKRDERFSAIAGVDQNLSN